MENKKEESYPICFLVKNASEEAQEVNLFDLAKNHHKEVIVKSAEEGVDYKEILEKLKQNSYKITSTMIIAYDSRMIEKAMPVDKNYIEFCYKDEKGVDVITRAKVTINPYQQQVDRTIVDAEYTLGKDTNIKMHLNGWTRVVIRCYPVEKIAN